MHFGRGSTEKIIQFVMGVTAQIKHPVVLLTMPCKSSSNFDLIGKLDKWLLHSFFFGWIELSAGSIQSVNGKFFDPYLLKVVIYFMHANVCGAFSSIWERFYGRTLHYAT